MLEVQANIRKNYAHFQLRNTDYPQHGYKTFDSSDAFDAVAAAFDNPNVEQVYSMAGSNTRYVKLFINNGNVELPNGDTVAVPDGLIQLLLTAPVTPEHDDEDEDDDDNINEAYCCETCTPGGKKKASLESYNWFSGKEV